MLIGFGIGRGAQPRWLALVLFFWAGMAWGAESSNPYIIERHGNAVEIRAGILSRKIDLSKSTITTTDFALAGERLIASSAREFSVTVSLGRPNQKPRGLKPESVAALESTAHFAPETNSAIVGSADEGGVVWVAPVQLRADSWGGLFDKTAAKLHKRGQGRQRLVLQAKAKRGSPIEGLKVELCYEVYRGFPVIRKWVEITNNGKRWLKLNDLVIDDVELAPAFRHQTPLTPGERGAGPSVVAFGTENRERGVIAVSEIPSALRLIKDSGAMGYAGDYFEWVLGPGEKFVSEPVFFFAWQGRAQKTISAISTPLDRAVEGAYLQFLQEQVGVAADQGTIRAPQWCSWSNFGQNINDEIISEQAVIAARCGFSMVLLDQGWQRDLVGTDPDPRKFPDFARTSAYIHSLGLKVGLWVSSYRSLDYLNHENMAWACSVPILKRDGGFGMSYSSQWHKVCARELTEVSLRYGVDYFKQDFTNIKFGDIAEGHENRTRKESLLRGLRGLFETQDMLRKAAPEVTTEITHEIYWGTPGVPCDVAAVKHVAAYHIPPNDYAGMGQRGRVSQSWMVHPRQLEEQLMDGCFHARERFYAHRGLPLYAIEYYAAHAVNVSGSLSPAAQDRQVCSWLMGAPSVFAGDLASLTPANIALYRARFDLLRRLERDYGILRRFQFSGVPAPTDRDWHWWGKLKGDGTGAVVVLRGREGEPERAVNIPWVIANWDYEVTATLQEKPLGRFTGEQLQNGALRLALPTMGQEILELKAVR